jgi:hypothetical protein
MRRKKVVEEEQCLIGERNGYSSSGTTLAATYKTSLQCDACWLLHSSLTPIALPLAFRPAVAPLRHGHLSRRP